MKKFLKVIPIVLILAMVLAISVAGTAQSFTLGSSQYYSKSPTVFGYNGVAYMNVSSASSCSCYVKIFGYNSATTELRGVNTGYPGGARVGTGMRTDHSYYNWYGYMQPTSSSGLGGVAVGDAAAE